MAAKLNVQWEKAGSRKHAPKQRARVTFADYLTDIASNPTLAREMGRLLRGSRTRNAGFAAPMRDKNRDLADLLADTNVESLDDWFDNFNEQAYSNLNALKEGYEIAAEDMRTTSSDSKERVGLMRRRNELARQASNLSTVIDAVHELQPRVESFNQIAMSKTRSFGASRKAELFDMREAYKLPQETPADVTESMKFSHWLAGRSVAGRVKSWVNNVVDTFQQAREGRTNAVSAMSFIATAGQVDPGAPLDYKRIFDLDSKTPLSAEAEHKGIVIRMPDGTDSKHTPPPPADLAWEEADDELVEDADWVEDAGWVEDKRYSQQPFGNYQTPPASPKQQSAGNYQTPQASPPQQASTHDSVYSQAAEKTSSTQLDFSGTGYASAEREFVSARKLKKRLETRLEDELEPMRAAILRYGLELTDLPTDASGLTRDVDDIRKDINKIDFETTGAERLYNNYNEELENLVDAYRDIIFDQAFAPEGKVEADLGSWIDELERHWGKITKKSTSKAKKFYNKLGWTLKRLHFGRQYKRKKAKVDAEREKLDKLRTAIGSSYNCLRHNINQSKVIADAFEPGSAASNDFEELFVKSSDVVDRCHNSDQTYGLTFKSPRKWGRAAKVIIPTILGLFGAYEASTWIWGNWLFPGDGNGDGSELINQKPDIREGAKQDVYNIFQGDTEIINLTGPDGLFQDDGPLDFLVDKNFGNYNDLDLSINSSAEVPALYIKTSNPAQTPDAGTYTFRVHANERDTTEKHTIHDDITVQIKDNPTEFDGYVESLGVDAVSGKKLFKLNTTKLVDAQGLPDVDVKIGDGDWISIDNLTANQIIEMDRALRPGLTETQVRATDPYRNEKTFYGEVDVPDTPTKVTGGQVNQHDLDYNITIGAGTILAERFNVVDWDGPAHGDLVMKLTDSEGNVKQAIKPLQNGEMSINLTYMAGELEGGNCSLQVTHSDKMLISKTGYVWQSAPEVDVDAEDGEHDYLLSGMNANHTFNVTAKNDAGQETTVDFVVNGKLAGSTTFNATEMSGGECTKGVTLERKFTQGINTILATPSDFDTAGNPYIDAESVVESVTFTTVNHVPEVSGNLSEILHADKPLTNGYSRSGLIEDLFIDIDGDELTTVNETDIIFTGGKHKYDSATGRLELYPTAEGLQTLTVYTRDPVGEEAVASTPIEVVARPVATVLDCYTDSTGALYLNGEADFGAECMSLEVILRSGGIEKARFPVELIDGVFNATTPSGLSSDVYDAEMIGHDANGAKLSNSLTDKVVVMPTPERIIETQYFELNAAIKNAIDVDFRQDIIDSQNPDEVYDIVGNIIALHTSHSNEQVKVPLELTEAAHYAYETVIPSRIAELNSDLLYPDTTIASTGAKKARLTVHRAGEDLVIIPGMGVYSYEEVRSWDYQFATDEDCDRLTPQELEVAIQRSIGNVDERNFEDNFATYDSSVPLIEKYRQALVNMQLDDVLKEVGAIKKLPEATRSSLLADMKAGTFIYDMA